MKTVLITGSTGFIVTHFQSQFKMKYKVETLSFFRDDFDKLDLSQIDVVVHLAALVHQMGGVSKDEYYRVNVSNTMKFAQKAKEDKVKHFVFMSTVKIYGEETIKGNYVEASKCLPQNDYGKSKLKAEHELQKLENETFKVSIIRTPVVYGHGVKANIKNLIVLIKAVPILPVGGIRNKRSFVYIGNLCDMIDRIIEEKKGGVFLAADDEPISTTDLINMISNAMGKKTILIKIPLFEAVLKLLKPSIHKKLYGNLIVDNTVTKKKLNFKNRFSTKEGIRLMVDGG